MKRVIVKRLMYRDMRTNHIFYGGEEYDGRLTNENILGAIYTLGKHEWCPGHYGLYQLNQNGEIVYKIMVQAFEYAEKSWYNLFWDWVRRAI